MRTATLKGWLWVHKWSSLVSMTFLLMLCITGLPLIFKDEIHHWLDGRPCKTSATRMNIGFAPVLLGARFPENLRIRF
jgi:uncharacterized iron-regulated membrane protein